MCSPNISPINMISFQALCVTRWARLSVWFGSLRLRLHCEQWNRVKSPRNWIISSRFCVLARTHRKDFATKRRTLTTTTYTFPLRWEEKMTIKWKKYSQRCQRRHNGNGITWVLYLLWIISYIFWLEIFAVAVENATKEGVWQPNRLCSMIDSFVRLHCTFMDLFLMNACEQRGKKWSKTENSFDWKKEFFIRKIEQLPMEMQSNWYRNRLMADKEPISRRK